jgi:hypothetical protein
VSLSSERGSTVIILSGVPFLDLVATAAVHQLRKPATGPCGSDGNCNVKTILDVVCFEGDVRSYKTTAGKFTRSESLIAWNFDNKIWCTPVGYTGPRNETTDRHCQLVAARMAVSTPGVPASTVSTVISLFVWQKLKKQCSCIRSPSAVLVGGASAFRHRLAHWYQSLQR